MKDKPQQPVDKSQLGNLKICPKCGSWNLEFDPHQGIWRCLVKSCGAIYRNGVPDEGQTEPQQPEVSNENTKMALAMRTKQQTAFEYKQAEEAMQPAEGELAPNPYEGWCCCNDGKTKHTDFAWLEDSIYHHIDRALKAQLAHDKARMVRLDNIEADHVMIALKIAYKDEWCVVCESVETKLLKLLKVKP